MRTKNIQAWKLHGEREKELFRVAVVTEYPAAFLPT